MRIDLPSLLLLALCSCGHEAQQGALSTKPGLQGTLVYETTFPDGTKGLSACTVPGTSTVALSDSWQIGSPSKPALSPDGKTLVFQGREEGKWHLYSYDLTSGEVPLRLMEGNSSDDTDPVFTADGGKILFSKGGQIAEYSLNTKKTKALTFEANATYAEPSVSADGRNILFSYTPESRAQLGILNLETLSSVTLFRDSRTARFSPMFCPDGKFCFVERSGKCAICLAETGKDSFKKVFQAADANYYAPSPACSGWIFFCKATDSGSCLYIGDVGNGTEYPADEFVPGINDAADISGAAFSAEKVSIAEPADGGGGQGSFSGDDTSSDQTLPVLKGKLVWHSYSSYETRDSKIWLYDFDSGTKTELSRSWTGLVNPMNGHFSPDGKYITFMAEGTATGSWDIFLYDLEAGGQPVNLTPSGSYRDEDPKFSFDGARIVFKREGHLAEITVGNRSVKVLSSGNTDTYSMPYYNVEGTRILFGGDSADDSYIGCWDIAVSRMTKLYDRAGVAEYYPVTLDAASFYYSAHYSADNRHDQLFKGWFDGRPAVSLAFNSSNADYSDACPAGGGWLILSSTRAGGEGAYDLFIGHESSGVIYSLSRYASQFNTSKNELGASYLPGN